VLGDFTDYDRSILYALFVKVMLYYLSGIFGIVRIPLSSSKKF
jgi:hypothetical protein